MQEFVDLINSYVWSPVLVYLLLAAGLFFSVLTRFVQVRLFREMIKLLFSSKESDRGISSFQALSVSLSGRVGTGNIAGVAAAIGFGGPGAVFWMWVVAFLGAATAYVESALGQIYKEEDEGQFRGGPAYYIEKAMGQKWYAWIFAVSTIFAVGLLLPTAAPLLGMLAFGNLMRESGVVERLTKMSQNELANIVTLFLGLACFLRFTRFCFCFQTRLFLFLHWRFVRRRLVVCMSGFLRRLLVGRSLLARRLDPPADDGFGVLLQS